MIASLDLLIFLRKTDILNVLSVRDLTTDVHIKTCKSLNRNFLQPYQQDDYNQKPRIRECALRDYVHVIVVATSVTQCVVVSYSSQSVERENPRHTSFDSRLVN